MRLSATSILYLISSGDQTRRPASSCYTSYLHNSTLAIATPNQGVVSAKKNRKNH